MSGTFVRCVSHVAVVVSHLRTPGQVADSRLKPFRRITKAPKSVVAGVAQDAPDTSAARLSVPRAAVMVMVDTPFAVRGPADRAGAALLVKERFELGGRQPVRIGNASDTRASSAPCAEPITASGLRPEGLHRQPFLAVTALLSAVLIAGRTHSTPGGRSDRILKRFALPFAQVVKVAQFKAAHWAAASRDSTIGLGRVDTFDWRRNVLSFARSLVVSPAISGGSGLTFADLNLAKNAHRTSSKNFVGRNPIVQRNRFSNSASRSVS